MKPSNGNLMAYPVPSNAKSDGLTKREMFAMAAMQGLCSDVKAMFDGAVVGESIADFIARQSVAAADALLAELEKQNEKDE